MPEPESQLQNSLMLEHVSSELILLRTESRCLYRRAATIHRLTHGQQRSRHALRAQNGVFQFKNDPTYEKKMNESWRFTTTSSQLLEVLGQFVASPASRGGI